MNRRLLIWGVLAFAAIVLLANSLFIVDQTHQALVLQVGNPVRVINAGPNGTPGLKAKVPFVQNVVQFDKRNLILEAAQEEIIAADNNRLVVDAYVRYRISDPLQYYRTLRNQTNAEARLQPLANSSLRQILGGAASQNIVSSQRVALMTRIRNDVAQRATDSRLGIQVIDVRIKRADLRTENQENVFRRMQTAQQQQATETRAVGERRKREIVAQATEDSEKIRGEGDARRAQIFASTYGKDASFARFYRSMQAYEASLGQGDTTMVLSPDSEFFRYFSRGPAAQ
ncbi:MAG: protease modulator HflC [Caulobacterales bacterium 68-7]|nr:MAG: protease modulator HflC [Caulobacterales bacterium 68-7]